MSNSGDGSDGFMLTCFVIFVFFLGLFLGIWSTAGGRHYTTEQKWQTETVERGYAEWITATDGTTTWQWKNEPQTGESE